MSNADYGVSRDDLMKLRSSFGGRLKMLAENPSNPSLATGPHIVSHLIQAMRDIDRVVCEMDGTVQYWPLPADNLPDDPTYNPYVATQGGSPILGPVPKFPQPTPNTFAQPAKRGPGRPPKAQEAS